MVNCTDICILYKVYVLRRVHTIADIYSRVVPASDCQCKYCPRGFNASILRHSEIWREADEAVSNEVLRKKQCVLHIHPSVVVVYTRMCRGCLSVRVIVRKLQIVQELMFKANFILRQRNNRMDEKSTKKQKRKGVRECKVQIEDLYHIVIPVCRIFKTQHRK
jgi:hypothetical protein